MKKKIEISDFVLFFGLGVMGAGLYLRFDLGTSLSVVGAITLLIWWKMAPKRSVE